MMHNNIIINVGMQTLFAMWHKWFPLSCAGFHDSTFSYLFYYKKKQDHLYIYIYVMGHRKRDL